MVDEGSCTWVDVPGTDPVVRIQIQNGQPLAILRAFVADINAYVEHVRDADTACWTPTNSVPSSNHLSATAVDVDWELHPFRVPNAGWSAQQLATIREIQDFYEGTVFHGNDWTDPKDAMHFQLASLANGGDIDTFNNPHTQDFIARKIRADGFSTYRRGNDPMPGDPAAILSQATGLSLSRATEILPTMTAGLQQAGCTNPKRIAMFIAQTGEESAGFSTTTEFASGAEYEGRCSDLGNCSPGDGVKYKGRTWIQVTGKAHYAEFSQWAFGKGLVSSPTFFVDNPTELSDIKWAGVGAAWYWTVSRPQINSLCDAGDIVGVTRAINGGTNGLQDRTDRYNRALPLGDQLLALINDNQQGDDMASVPQDQWDRVYRELTQQLPSRSPLRHLGEGLVDTMAGFVLNIDGSQHVEICKILAGYGHPPTLALLREVAAADPTLYPDRQDDAKMAQAILADLTSASVGDVPQAVAPTIATTSSAAPQVVYVDRPAAAPVDNGALVAANATIDRLRDENANLRVAAAQAASAPPPAPAPALTGMLAALPVVPAETGSTGEAIGKLYTALESLRLADALPIESRAPLAALISVLSTKNGATL